jgi:uncharacterized protein (DUF2384 family)
MITYIEQLNLLAKEKEIDLKLAFRKCGMPDSTYWRINKNHTILRQDTAQKVWNFLNDYKANRL